MADELMVADNQGQSLNSTNRGHSKFDATKTIIHRYTIPEQPVLM